MNLLICIALTSSFYLIFKVFDRLKIETYQAVVINYFVCVVTGVVFVPKSDIPMLWHEYASSLPYGVVLGCLFMTAFYMMARAAQDLSVAISTVSSKMSMVVPALYSLLVVHTGAYDWLNYFGMVLAILAIWFTANVKKSSLSVVSSKNSLLLVVGIFILTGIVDTLLTVVNRLYEDVRFQELFPIVCFACATFLGGIVLIYRFWNGTSSFAWKNVFGGMLLGVPNYFSIYFLFRALKDFNHNGALVYPVLNISIIVLSAGLSVLFFKDRLSRTTLVGILFAVVAIVLLSHVELVRLFD